MRQLSLYMHDAEYTPTRPLSKVFHDRSARQGTERDSLLSGFPQAGTWRLSRCHRCQGASLPILPIGLCVAIQRSLSSVAPGYVFKTLLRQEIYHCIVKRMRTCVLCAALYSFATLCSSSAASLAAIFVTAARIMPSPSCSRAKTFSKWP